MYLLIEFPSLDEALAVFREARGLFHTRCGCLSRSETNPKVSWSIFKDDVDQEAYEAFKNRLPSTCKYTEVSL